MINGITVEPRVVYYKLVQDHTYIQNYVLEN